MREPVRQPRPTRNARQLNVSSAVLALSVLADSGVEHYRGSFQNRAMYVPLGVAALTLGASLFGALDPRPRRHSTRDVVYAAAALTGIVGLGFHAYNIGKRPGGFSWLNLFYSAPIGAPGALVLAGLLGRSAESVRHARSGRESRLINGRRTADSRLGRREADSRADIERATADTGVARGRRSAVSRLANGRALAAISAAGLVGTVAEAALLHFRGAFHNPAMVAPVSIPPVAATLLGAAAVTGHPKISRWARWWLKLTALLGFAGVGLHAYGVSRNMGGWRNWSQNVLNGPPLPAPPSFTGLALSGLAALRMMEEHGHGRERR